MLGDFFSLQWVSKRGWGTRWGGPWRHFYRGGNFARKCISTTPTGEPIYIYIFGPGAQYPLLRHCQFVAIGLQINIFKRFIINFNTKYIFLRIHVFYFCTYVCVYVYRLERSTAISWMLRRPRTLKHVAVSQTTRYNYFISLVAKMFYTF